MNRGRRLLLLAVTMLLCLTACSNSSGETPMDLTENTAPEITVEVTPTQAAEEKTEEKPQWPILAADDRLEIQNCASYTGLYPEDGSDEQVEQVAAILVKNVSSEVLQFCSLSMTVDGEAATFVLSELPAGACVWVLEANRLTAPQTAEYCYVSDSSSFHAPAELSNISVTGGEGTITLTNQGETDCGSAAVYYKLLYDENTYLGGITYRVSVSDLKAGQSQTVTAGHYYFNAAEIIGIYSN